jgi:hypothetical protein
MNQKAINGSRISLFLLFLIGIMACKMNVNEDSSLVVPGHSGNNKPDTTNAPGTKLIIKVGATRFTATLPDTPTVTELKARLPMTVPMTELNGNEQLYNFPTGLPTNASNPGMIQTGDLMLYGSNTLVLFYKSFPTSYSYTRLGRIDHPAELSAALGPGTITVTFELE